MIKQLINFLKARKSFSAVCTLGDKLLCRNKPKMRLCQDCQSK